MVTDVRSSASSVLAYSNFCGVLIPFGKSLSVRAGVRGLALCFSVGGSFCVSLWSKLAVEWSVVPVSGVCGPKGLAPSVLLSPVS